LARFARLARLRSDNEYKIHVWGRITGYALSQTALRKSGPSGSQL
jgi:hypothetical protein